MRSRNFPPSPRWAPAPAFRTRCEVTITERLPVAFIKVGPRRTAVSADGYLLVGASFDPKHLPRIEEAAAHGPRLQGDAAAEAAILGAIPARPSRSRHRLELGRRAGRGGRGPRRRARPPLRRRFQGPRQVDRGGRGALQSPSTAHPPISTSASRTAPSPTAESRPAAGFPSSATRHAPGLGPTGDRLAAPK